MTAANRGRYAENKVRDYLKLVDASTTNFDWERVLDAHSAGGRFASRTGDFAWWATGLHGVIEVKEVEHASRLPYRNVTLEGMAKLRKRSWAGGQVTVLVYSTSAKVWRSPPWQVLDVRDPAKPSGSWDLSEFPVYGSVREALAGTDLAV